MNDPLDPRLPGGIEKHAAVADRVGKLEAAMIEPHPIGVVERRDAAERLDELFRLVEVERRGRQRPRRTGWAARRVGQRPHGASPIEQPPGDLPARVAIGAGDDVRL